MSDMTSTQAANIHEVVSLLKTNGLKVYGASTDLATGEQGPGCRDFEPNEVLRYLELKRRGMLHNPDQENDRG